MPRKAAVAPRKLPRQSRSQATVEAILTAAERVLVRTGYDGASTNRIAEAAGVSIGSLYQYFPSKEAIVVALHERHCDAIWSLFEAKLAEIAGAPLPQAVRTMIDLMVDAHGLNPKLHEVLEEEVPKRATRKRVRTIDMRMTELLRLALQARQAEIRPRDLEVAAFVLVHMCESICHAAVLGDTGLPRERIVDETTDAVLRYLLT